MSKKNITNNGVDVEVWQQGDAFHIDVRGLVPPQPMIAVLSLLNSEEVRDRIIVHIDREPIYLFPELEERGWAYETRTINADYFQIQISKRADGEQAD